MANPPTQQILGAGAIPIYDAGAMLASDGVVVPTGQLSPTFGYDGSSPPNLITITYTYLTHTYVQTLTYSGSNVTNISTLVKTS